MNLKTFEKEMHAWLDGARPELSAEAREYMQNDPEASRLHSQLLAIQTIAKNLPENELSNTELSNLKQSIHQRLKPDGNFMEIVFDRLQNLNRARVFSAATLGAACIVLAIWFWPAGSSNSFEQDFEFYLQEHQVGSTELVVAEFGLDD